MEVVDLADTDGHTSSCTNRKAPHESSKLRDRLWFCFQNYTKSIVPNFFSDNDLLYKCVILLYCRRQSGQILRLRGGNNPHIGFLQINIQGSWQMVKQVLKFLQHE